MNSRLTTMLAGAFIAMVLLIVLKVGLAELIVVAAIAAGLFFFFKGSRRRPGQPR